MMWFYPIPAGEAGPGSWWAVLGALILWATLWVLYWVFAAIVEAFDGYLYRKERERLVTAKVLPSERQEDPMRPYTFLDALIRGH